MSEHDEKAEERVEDLDVPESESDEVKGGALNAYSKIGQKFQKVDLSSQKVNPGGTRLGDGSV